MEKKVKKPAISLNPSLILHIILSFHPFNSLLSTPPKHKLRNQTETRNPSLLIFYWILFFTFLIISLLSLLPISHNSIPCFSSLSPTISPVFTTERDQIMKPSLSTSVMVPLPLHLIDGNLSDLEREFWKQPERNGYKPCLEFSIEYRKRCAKVSKEKRRFLVVVVSGGLNQQRNQIVDAVVVARVLEAALVVPVLKVNLIWEDESEFSELFDVEHFKRTLQADVRIVSSLPSTHLLPKQTIETQLPFDVSPLWIRTRFSKQINEEGLLILKGLDSKLSKNLPSDLQKLRCKVAFHALRFAAPIREIGNRLARRMWIEGPYIAIHLRLEKDVWVRTGCLTGLGSKYDTIVAKERESRPEFLTGRLNMTQYQRRVLGLCPLNSLEVARLIKALGAPKSSRIYIAGGEPFGGTRALDALVSDFPNISTKETLARENELAPFLKRSSAMAAIDYIVSLSSDVFIPSHGGNMGQSMQGHRAYVGHRKYIKPNKRTMLAYFEDSSISEEEFGNVIRKLHKKSYGQPEYRFNKRDRDVLAYPVPECMCN